MRLSRTWAVDVWRTTVFRLTSIYCAMFGLGVVALLGLVYWQAAHDLTKRIDDTLRLEVASLLPSTPEELPDKIRAQLAANVTHNTHLALFSHDGVLVAGDIVEPPADLRPLGRPVDLPAMSTRRPPLRALAVTTAWGETLVVGRDIGPVSQVRGVILHALVWSGVLIAGVGFILATALSISPLRRLRTLQTASRSIASGRLEVRMPVAGRHDELDLFAGTVNVMVAEIERLLGEVKSVTDAAAHDLRTPLTRVRARLYRVAHEVETSEPVKATVETAIADLDAVLDRFAALLRISELETHKRRAAFAAVSPAEIVAKAVELYEPLAEEGGVTLESVTQDSAAVEADGRLLFEAVSNLVDNAIKFTPAGGRVTLSVRMVREGPEIVVSDTGPGLIDGERQTVLQRFYRGANSGTALGSGLGLSLVAAIVRLHRFALRLEDAQPGLRAVLACWPHGPD